MTGVRGIGLDRVEVPTGVLPQAAERLDALSPVKADEVGIAVERLNLDAASFTQIHDKHDGNPAAIRREVLDIITARGKMHNPVTGSGGMLIGTVEEVGPESPLGLKVGDRVATLVSLTLTPLRIDDELANWEGTEEQIPCKGRAILFGRSIAAKLPDDLGAEEALAVFDVCGAPALTSRVVKEHASKDPESKTLVAVIGGAGKSGSLSLAAARDEGAVTVGVVPVQAEYDALVASGLADHVVIADARNPVQLSEAITGAIGRPADVTVLCVNVPGCEGGAILSTQQGGTIIFFSMATHFAAAALGAEGLAADVTMLVGNGYVPGHANFALDVYRRHEGVQKLFAPRFAKDPA